MFRFLLFFIFLCTTLFADELIKPIPLHVSVNTTKAKLGKQLFFDTRLSHDNTIACVSCHNLSLGGADATMVSFGVAGRSGTLNSPTVYNSIYNIAQFWDGRSTTLHEQASGPILNPVEMNSNEKELITKLSKNPDYVQKFKSLYEEGITLHTITDAIAEYEKTLITPNSRFDKFLRGNKNALNNKEKEGYMLFKNYGCISCHNGVNIGSNMFQQFGIFASKEKSHSYLGRYNVTKLQRDKHFVKVPTLRNIDKTAPYFHDGSVKSLAKAVEIMGTYQLGMEIPKKDIKKIVLFLHTLNGELPNAN